MLLNTPTLARRRCLIVRRIKVPEPSEQHELVGSKKETTTMAGEVLHEERDHLTPEILDRHRALSVMIEELEAIDWYDQRIQASDDQELKSILLNNREEEKEHFAMLLEWLRRNDAGFERKLATYLYMAGPIRDVENGGGTDAPATPATSAGSDGSLSIGSLRIQGAGR